MLSLKRSTWGNSFIVNCQAGRCGKISENIQWSCSCNSTIVANTDLLLRHHSFTNQRFRCHVFCCGPAAVQRNGLAVDVTAFLRCQEENRVGHVLNSTVTIEWSQFLVGALESREVPGCCGHLRFDNARRYHIGTNSLEIGRAH